MPRLVPRLLKSLQNFKLKGRPSPHDAPASLASPKEHRRRSSPRAIPRLPAIAANDRSQSILVDNVNPIVNAEAFIRRKSPAARLRTGSEDGEMSEEERDWWSSPYLRMLASPIRLCLSSNRYLPSDFLIRVGLKQQPGTQALRSKHYLLPDGIEHPKFKQRKTGIAGYFVCWKTAFELGMQTNSYQRLSAQAVAHPRLTEQIGHLLRLRVLQELELLVRRWQARRQDSLSVPIIRRLTRAEWKALRATGTVPYENAVAVIVCPPVNRDPKTKTRPQPEMSPSPAADAAPRPRREPLSLSVLYPTTTDSIDDTTGILPPARVPLYNGAALFPHPSHRAALHAHLKRLLTIESRSRPRETARLEKADDRGASSAKPREGRDGDDKHSHAFLIHSSRASVERADVVPLAIALWRIRMWEGDVWRDSSEGSDAGGWEDPSSKK
ncbi:hypothetical protein OE88DRAFT_1804611 [Heliocybe sulcata]|uniref:Uncharacterized protein n=1 Tax=Heliocybe sulcata TaxID=5364 RepID=A0A5C3NI96_9AGAM|nr:hypothetical protein OE88DRAFT_1804611 [Heliocybe sulcata]